MFQFYVNISQVSSKIDDSYGWKNKTTITNLDLFCGNIVQPEEYNLKSNSAKLVVEEFVEKENLDVDQDVCFIDQCKIFNETRQRNKLIRFSAEVSQVRFSFIFFYAENCLCRISYAGG